MSQFRPFCLMFVAVGLVMPLSPALAGAVRRPTLAVLPFVAASPGAQPLAERLRFAVGAKMTRRGHFKRLTDHAVDQMISALQIPWRFPPRTADVRQVIKALGVEQAVMGLVRGRRLTLELFIGPRLIRKVSAVIPPDNTSPRLTLERLLAALDHLSFKHPRTRQFDSNPALAALFAQRPNLLRDPQFAATGPSRTRDPYWTVLLKQQDYHPRVLSANLAQALPRDQAAIVPQNIVPGAGPAARGHCLMLRIGDYVAQNNGLACESDWIPVHDGQRYRFSVQYHSMAPRIRIFLKGFAYWPDRFSSPADPASQRKEIYRAQLLPVGPVPGRGQRSAGRPNPASWQTTTMDFTPQALPSLNKKYPIRWIRIDFYVYLHAGDAFFRKVLLKNITVQAPATVNQPQPAATR